MKQGVVSIYYKGGLIKSRRYFSMTERKVLLKEWEKQCGDRFYRCEILIAPNVKLDAIDKKGRNINKNPKHSDLIEQPIIPPKSSFKKGGMIKYAKVHNPNRSFNIRMYEEIGQ